MAQPALSNSESRSVVVKTFTDMQGAVACIDTHKIDTVLSLVQLNTEHFIILHDD